MGNNKRILRINKRMCNFCIRNVRPVVSIIVLISLEIYCGVNDSKKGKPNTISLLEPFILQDESNRTYLNLDIKLALSVSINNHSVSSEQLTNNVTIQAIHVDKINQVFEDSLHYLMTYITKSFINLWFNVSGSSKGKKDTKFYYGSVSKSPPARREILTDLKGANNQQYKFNERLNYLSNSYSSSAENKYSDVDEIIKQIYPMKADNPVLQPSLESTSLKETNKYWTNDSIVTSTSDNRQHMSDLIRQRYLLRSSKQRAQLKKFLIEKMSQKQQRRPSHMVANALIEINAPHSTPVVLERRSVRPNFETVYPKDEINYNLHNFRRVNDNDWTLKQEIATELPATNNDQLRFKNKLHSNEFNTDTGNFLDRTEGEYNENYNHVIYAETENPLNYDETMPNNEFRERDTGTQIGDENVVGW